MAAKSPKKSLLDYFKPVGGKPAKKMEDDSVEEVEAAEPEPEEPEVVTVTDGRRPTRACANKARHAWNEPEESSSSSDDEDGDFRRKRGKRGRKQNASKKSTQTTLSKNGKIVKKETEKENRNAKKKPRLSPETIAFLKSGVPDVIEKAKAKAQSSAATIITLDESDEKSSSEKEIRKLLDPETLAFLHSGLPESVKKAKQTIQKKREEDESLVCMGFFPRISHTCKNEDAIEDVAKTEVSCRFPIKNAKSPTQSQQDSDLLFETATEHLQFYFNSSSSASDFSCLSSQQSDLFHPVGLCCDDNSVRVSSQENSQSQEDVRDYRPWIETTKVASVKDLVVDPNGKDTLMRWLKQWRSDIKDDGGTSRKLEKKKKRGNSSDSDFVTSDEGESEMKKKSLLLTGPSGSGKTAAVYVLAKHYQFEVVEVNFSSRRPGKEVLQRVEEAVLSHRQKSSHNCLLLFKDIDLFHPEEDEGFFSAVAQLITTAVRPIVMTSSLPVYATIDSKLDRKDPLRIAFNFPKPRDIVEKILKPILAATKNSVESDSMTQVDLWLDSIARHSGCDIRRCINQLQLLLSTCKSLTNDDIHLYSSPFLPHSVDLNFPRQPSIAECNSSVIGESQEDEINMSLTARKKRCQKQLEKLNQSLELFSDLEWISHPSTSCPTRNFNMFCDLDEANWHWNHVSGFRAPFFYRLSSCLGDKDKPNADMKWMRELVLESDADIDKWMQIEGLNDDVGQYCGLGGSSTGGDWESHAAIRTIVKNNKLDSAVGRVQKRHGRAASYFNRIDRNLVDRISNTFDFQTQLDAVKLRP